MIIRTLLLRHGRFALPRSTTASQCRRTFATSVKCHASTSLAPANGDETSLAPQRSFDIRDPEDPIAQNYIFHQHQRAQANSAGSTLVPHYRPSELVTHPPSPEDITLELLLASQSHIGHAASLWHPANAKYIFGVRGHDDPIHIISLDVTAAYLRRACKIVRGVTERGGLVLFVGTRRDQERAVVRAAQLSGGCHLFTKWIAGSITNGQQILGGCSKKVVDENDVEVLGFGNQLEQSASLKPDLVVCLNPLENYILLHECGLHNIPTIGIIDTDANPTWVTYPIPANDDSLRCAQVICGALGRAGEQGQEARRERVRQGILPLHNHNLRPPTAGQAKRELEMRQRQAVLAQEQYEEQARLVGAEEAIGLQAKPMHTGEGAEYDVDMEQSSGNPDESSEAKRLMDWEMAELERDLHEEDRA